MTPALNLIPNGRQARRVVEAVLAVLIAVQAVRLGVILLRPDPPTSAAPAPASKAVDASILARFDPFHRGAAEGAAPAGDAQGLKLFGVRAGAGGGAIIAGPDGVQKSYGLGQEVQPGLVLTAVHSDHVVLTRAGVGGSLYFDAAAPAQAARALIPPPPPPVGAAGSNPMAPAAPSETPRR